MARVRRSSKIVHLGNVGSGLDGEVLGEETYDHSKKFPSLQFIGIDRSHYPPASRNWLQHNADFLEGLRNLAPGSVREISGKMSLGYYGKGEAASDEEKLEYTREVIKAAYSRLEPKGKLALLFDDSVRMHSASKMSAKEILEKAIAGVPFSSVSLRQLTPSISAKRGFWVRKIASGYPYGKIFRLTAVK